MALTVCGIAVLVWFGVVYFALAIDADVGEAVQEISLVQQEGAKRDADSAAVALAATTEVGRAALSSIINKNALSLRDTIVAAGRDAGVELTIANVTQGPGPSLSKGSALRPASITFSLYATGSFQKLITLADLLAVLPAASSIERVQLSAPTGGDNWSMNADIRMITGNPV